jgi:Amt family ammonium transporter
MKFAAWGVFTLVWVTLVYFPIAHAVWGGGILGWGSDLTPTSPIDFAGGTVVHINAGAAGLALALVLGKRRGFGREPMPPHSLPLCVAGAGLLWFGWFGFNAGSALSASPLAALAFLNTSTATSTAVVTWAVIEWLHRGKPTALGIATAAVAGLVAITPACGNVSPMGSIAVGFGVSLACYAALTFLKPLAGYDDSLDAFGVHGVGGAVGSILTGVFAAVALGGTEQIAIGRQVGVQLLACAVAAAWSGGMSWVLIRVVDLAMGVRVDDEQETIGLDLTNHEERGYDLN